MILCFKVTVIAENSTHIIVKQYVRVVKRIMIIDRLMYNTTTLFAVAVLLEMMF